MNKVKHCFLKYAKKRDTVLMHENPEAGTTGALAGAALGVGSGLYLGNKLEQKLLKSKKYIGIPTALATVAGGALGSRSLGRLFGGKIVEYKKSK